MVIKHRHQLVLCSVSIYTLIIFETIFKLHFSSIVVFQHEEPTKQLHESMYGRQFSGDQIEIDLDSQQIDDKWDMEHWNEQWFVHQT